MGGEHIKHFASKKSLVQSFGISLAVNTKIILNPYSDVHRAASNALAHKEFIQNTYLLILTHFCLFPPKLKMAVIES